MVCAVPDLSTVISAAPDLLMVTPGIRMADGATHDQQRVATPERAIRAGSGLLVIGRAVTGADDRAAAATAVTEAIESAL